MLGLSRDEIINAVSLAWVDGQSLRTYRHSPNTGSRKSWAAGDATSRAVRLALIAKTGEMGYPSVLSAKTWGFYDVLFKGNAFKFQRPYGSYVMENVLFKISFPAEFHSQTAVECAMQIHEQLVKAGKSAEDIKKITIRTHEACIRIIDKKGPLNNPADRDHCIQYMVAVPILFGRLTAEDYEDSRREAIRASTSCATRSSASRTRSSPRTTTTPNKRSIANALTVEFTDGKKHEGDRVRVPDRPSSVAARKACPCWSRSSRPTSRGSSPRSSRAPSSTCAWTRRSSCGHAGERVRGFVCDLTAVKT